MLQKYTRFDVFSIICIFCSKYLPWVTEFQENQLIILQSNLLKPPPIRRPVLSPPKPILIQSLLYKTTTCLTRPATIFLSPKRKKTCLKQKLQNFIQRRNEKQCIKNKSLRLQLLCCYFIMQSLFVYKNSTFTFNIGSW